MTEGFSGGCQCGAVRYTATTLKDDAHICHCRMCQKAVGNYFAAFVGVPAGAFALTRGEPATFLSSEHVERGFCAQCGTPLFYRDVVSGGFSLTIGALDHPDQVAPKTQDGIEGRVPFFGEITATPDKGITGEGKDAEWAREIAQTNRQHPDQNTSKWPATE